MKDKEFRKLLINRIIERDELFCILLCKYKGLDFKKEKKNYCIKKSILKSMSTDILLDYLIVCEKEIKNLKEQLGMKEIAL